jgi:hypothetical protein
MTVPPNTLDGWVPQIGDRVHYALYNPNPANYGDLAQQVAADGGIEDVTTRRRPGGDPPVFVVREIHPHHIRPGVTRYALAEDGRREPTNWPDDDYAVLWLVPSEQGGLW